MTTLTCKCFMFAFLFFFFSSRRRHTRCLSDWSSDCALPIYAGRKCYPADLRGWTAEIQRSTGGGTARAVAPDLPASDSGRISRCVERANRLSQVSGVPYTATASGGVSTGCSPAFRNPVQSGYHGLSRSLDQRNEFFLDRKSTRLNSSHLGISYA